MDKLIEFLKKESTKIFITFFVIILFFIIFKKMLNLFLLTFILVFLTYSLQEFLYKNLNKFIRIRRLTVIIFMYTIIFSAIGVAVTKYVPIIITQTSDLINDLNSFMLYSGNNDGVKKYILPLINQMDLNVYLKGGTNYLLKFARNIGTWSFNIFIAIILSIVFIFEVDTVKKFVASFKNSRISGFYKYASIIGHNFLNSFGKVIEVQLLIAFVNTLISTILLGVMNFPHLLTLSVMIFFLSLIPVAGAIISLIPLSIIAFNIGGMAKIVYVFVMIFFIHAIESYFLNPKFMSEKTKLPVFVVFLVLIISEHFFGVWGLLLGIPTFVFILNTLNVKLKKSI